MGYQLRSYPVSYYGFDPAGWGAPGTGHEETTPAWCSRAVRQRVSDTCTLGRDAANRDASLCTRSDGSVAGCVEHVVTYCEGHQLRYRALNANSFRVSFARRNQTAAATLQVRLQLIDSSGRASTDVEAIPLAATSSTAWQVAGPVTLAATSPIADIKSVRLELIAPLSGGLAASSISTTSASSTRRR